MRKENRIYIFRVTHKGITYFIKSPEGKKKVYAYEDKGLKIPAKYPNGGRIMFSTKNLLRVK